MLAAGTAAALVLAPPGIAPVRAQVAAAGPGSAELPTLAPLVKKVMPAVVNISVRESAAADEQDEESGPQLPPGSPFDEFLRRFFEQQGINPDGPGLQQAPPQQKIALGSGFIIDPSGLVVTNNHVVDGAKEVTVLLQDGTKHPGKILGRDPKTDLALLKIDVGHPLPYVSWGDSSKEQVGDWVVAIGNPFGLGGTVSAGIVSARGRDIHSGPYDDFLQIDAPINRGNSGGPTFNLAGEVVGINTAIYSPNGGSVGIGFAIPSNLAKPVIDQLREHGTVSRGWLGVQVQEVTPALAKTLGLPSDHGALVSDVIKGGPAEKAGLRPGDVIEAFNGHDIAKMRDLPIMVAETPVGNEAQLKIWRKDRELTLSFALGELPEHPEAVAGAGGESGTVESASALGLRLGPLTPELRRELRIPESVKGVAVRSIADSSPLSTIDLEAGDVIQSINQQEVTTPKEAAEKLKAAMSGPDKRLLLLLNRHGINEYVAFSEQSNQG